MTILSLHRHHKCCGKSHGKEVQGTPEEESLEATSENRDIEGDHEDVAC